MYIRFAFNAAPNADGVIRRMFRNGDLHLFFLITLQDPLFTINPVPWCPDGNFVTKSIASIYNLNVLCILRNWFYPVHV